MSQDEDGPLRGQHVDDVSAFWPPERKDAHLRGLTCYCSGHCPPDHHNGGEAPETGTCVARLGAKCFTAVREVVDEATGEASPSFSYGCQPPDDEGGMLQCQGHLVPHLEPASIACCSDGDLCNRDLRPMYTVLDDYGDAAGDAANDGFAMLGAGIDQTTAIALVVSLTVCFVIFIILIVLAYLRYKKREDSRQKYMQTARTDSESYANFHPGGLAELIEQSSGSGSGLPLLVQRTIAKQVQMERSIGKGRYGEVWLAKWRGDNVAVKVFHSVDETSWFRETEIYQTVLMRHDNILGFVAADIKGSGGWTQMLLITDYHEHGSLHDFLKHATLDVEQMIHLCYSFACGLTHLHTEIKGTNSKHAIAHRDIKTRNILVKRDGTCAIADFGLAVRFEGDKNEVDYGSPNQRVGTIRYMSPEVLDQNMRAAPFQSYVRSDMYSSGLVFWEVAWRTSGPVVHNLLTEKSDLVSEDVIEKKQMLPPACDSYELPYFDYVNPDPSFEEMHAVVCAKKIRPSMPHRWSQCTRALQPLARLMSECWNENPNARPTALRVKKTLAELAVSLLGEKEEAPSIRLAP